MFLPIRKRLVFANLEGFYFCQPGGVPICQSGGVLFLLIRRGPNFANPEGYCICLSGGVLFLSIRRGIFLSRLKKTEEKKIVKVIRFLRDRLGTSDCTGNLPFIKDQTTKQNRSKLGYSRH